MRSVQWDRGGARARPASCLGWSIGCAGCRVGGTRPPRSRARRRPHRRRRRAAADRRCRPGASGRVSGSMSVSSPTSTSESSRGSATSIARTVCRPATAVSGARQSIGPRKSEMIATSPAVVRDVADGVERPRERRAGRPFFGRLDGERPEQPEHAVPATGRRHDGLAAGTERDDAEPIRSARDEPTDDEGGALGHVGLAAVGGAEVHRRRRVEQEPRGELAIRHVLADLGHEAAGRGVPVDAADVVAGLVRPQPVEVQAESEAGARDGRRPSAHRRGGRWSPRAGGPGRPRWGRDPGGPASAARP